MLSEWEAISPPSDPGSRNVRRADSGHPLDFRIGRDYRGRYVFQLDAQCVVPAAATDLPKMSALACEIEPVGEAGSRLTLVLGQTADFRNFALMCTSLMLATEKLAPSQSKRGLFQAVEELHRWQEMLRRRADRLLSKSEQIGLIGELLFLRDVLGDRLGWSEAIKCWNGPGGHEQDFVIAGSLFEVKTQVVTADRRIRISSEDQLDPVQGRILLCNQGIAPSPSSNLAARTLNTLVSEITEAMTEAGKAAPELLDIALLEAGYEERPDYDEESWVLVDRVYYEVSGGFPRIERSDLRPGVDLVKYSIRVSDCVPYIVIEDDAFREFCK
jgi:hypothetical protein